MPGIFLSYSILFIWDKDSHLNPELTMLAKLSE